MAAGVSSRRGRSAILSNSWKPQTPPLVSAGPIASGSLHRNRGAFILQSVVASVFALIVLAIIGTLEAWLVVAVSNLFTIFRPRVIEFVAMVLGGGVGVVAPRRACDAVLRDYSGRAVAVVIVIFSAATIADTFINPSHQWSVLNTIAQSVVVIWTAIGAFWVRRREPQPAISK